MMRSLSRFSVATAVLLVGASSASADSNEVEKRLTKFGELRRGESESLAENISKRMKRAADMTSANDPLRLAVAKALKLKNPHDAMSAAKIRLRLYAGLNEWALENLFVAEAGGIGRCQQQFGATSRQCEALIAAAGKMSSEEASKLAGGAPPPMPVAARPAAPPAQGSRFGTYKSGYNPAAAPAPAQRPVVAAQRPVAPAPMVAPNPNAKEDYARKRAEYLERKRLEMEARKAKLVAAQGGRVERGPAADSASAGSEPAAQAKAPTASKAAPEEVAAVDEAPAEAAPKKEALDGDLLNDLLGDPLGKK